MPYAFQGSCYPTVLEAGQAWCATVQPEIFVRSSDSSVRVMSCQSAATNATVNSANVNFQDCSSNAGTCIGSSRAVYFPSCDPVLFRPPGVGGVSQADAVTLSWLVVAAWVGVFALRLLARGRFVA